MLDPAVLCKARAFNAKERQRCSVRSEKISFPLNDWELADQAWPGHVWAKTSAWRERTRQTQFCLFKLQQASAFAIFVLVVVVEVKWSVPYFEHLWSERHALTFAEPQSESTIRPTLIKFRSWMVLVRSSPDSSPHLHLLLLLNRG